MTKQKLLTINNLSVSGKEINNLKDLNFSLYKGEIVGLFGEAFAGKTTICNVLNGFTGPKTVAEGEIIYNNNSKEINLLKLKQNDWEEYRGKKFAMLPYNFEQALDPRVCCGKQIIEVLKTHHLLKRADAKKQSLALMEEAGIHQAEDIFGSFPHQLNKELICRVLLAMIIALEPEILVVDNITAYFDPHVQDDLLNIIKSLNIRFGTSILFMSHHISTISALHADRNIILRHGEIIEEYDKKAELLYTKSILASRPFMEQHLRRLPVPDGTSGLNYAVPDAKNIITELEQKLKHKELYAHEALLEIKHLVVNKKVAAKSLFSRAYTMRSIDDLSVKLYAGETLGIIGDENSGKTSLAHVFSLIEKPASGEFIFKNKIYPYKDWKKKNTVLLLNSAIRAPKNQQQVQQIIQNAVKANKKLDKTAQKQRASELIKIAGLKEKADWQCKNLSEQELARLGIAAQFIYKPCVVVVDEQLSSLDTIVQAYTMNMLNDAKEKMKFALVLIEHDPVIIKYMCDRIILMNQGVIEEQRLREEILSTNADAEKNKVLAALL